MVKPCLPKNTKISWAWWWVPVVPATWRLGQENRVNQGGYSELPGQQEQNSVSKKHKQKKNNKTHTHTHKLVQAQTAAKYL